MSRFIDSVIAFRILKLLTTPFEMTDAFRLGIIDSKGKELKRMSQLNSVDERDAYTILHRMVFRLKKIVEKVPVENKKLASYAAALSLVKEQVKLGKEPIELESLYIQKLDSNLSEEIVLVENYINNKYTMTFKQFLDEEGIPANNAGTPGVAGFTPDTVGVSKKLRKKDKIFLEEVRYKMLGKITSAITNLFGGKKEGVVNIEQVEQPKEQVKETPVLKAVSKKSTGQGKKRTNGTNVKKPKK